MRKWWFAVNTISAVRVKDEAVYSLKNRMEEAGSALLKTAPVAVDKVVASSCAEKLPRASIP